MKKQQKSDRGRIVETEHQEHFKGSPDPDAWQALESGEPTLTGSHEMDDLGAEDSPKSKSKRQSK
jgi:hypothetical protein